MPSGRVGRCAWGVFHLEFWELDGYVKQVMPAGPDRWTR
jgi:hypothetical protein